MVWLIPMWESPTKPQAASIFQLVEPQRGLGVTRHAPVAARREAYRPDFWPVRLTRPLELVRKKPFEEQYQPLADLGGRVGRVEIRMFCEVQDLLRRGGEAQEMV